jgi:uncharacterized circularly permuted ATP-grasp superfamily protein/uncharacterized alpha-E superfamily protein
MTELLSAYQTLPERYDEFLLPERQPRASWRPLLKQLQALTAPGLKEREELLQKQIRENGVTYNVYADPGGASRPWALDLLPQLIDAEEWAELAAGVAQRAKLLDLMLADLYGPQQLLQEGLLPADLVYGHRNWLPPVQGLKPAGEVWLHVYAVDLARAPDGRWWVLADRTQSPSGAGYALENRHLVARAFPELFRTLGVRRLEAFFATLRRELLRLAVTDGSAPLAVLLTPGRYNETYFEHVYLARQLGFPLVEGQDLTVRDATVYLKTLDGLKRVHAIFRRLDDDWCDPLELRGDSALGVPGLLGAARAGRVMVANALGSGLLESPGLMPYLPEVAARLLDEPLRLPSVRTWWCGNPAALAEVLPQLSQLVLKPVAPRPGVEPLFGAGLDAAALAALQARICARPGDWVAQALLPLSQAPVWSSTRAGLLPRPLSLRAYAVATPDGWQVMPGGLTRVASEAGARIVSMQRGGSSKDTWVSGGGADPDSAAGPRIRTLVRHDPHLLSRTVENLYWLGRYSERCDGHGRLLRSLLNRLGDAEEQVFDAGFGIARAIGLLPADSDLLFALGRAIADRHWQPSLRADLGRLVWSATQVRAQLSAENWRAIEELDAEALRLEPAQLGRGQAMAFLNRLLIATTALSGFALDDMTRDDGWRFLMIGRSLERLGFLTRMLRQALAAAELGAPLLAWLLELGNSTITYRTRYLAPPQPVPVIDLLLLAEDNPHALLFQAVRLIDTLRLIGFDPGDIPALAALPARLKAIDTDALLAAQRLAPVQTLLLGELEAIAAALAELAERLMLRHFAHVDDVSRTIWSA